MQRVKTKKMLIVFAAALAVVAMLALAACGGGSSSSSAKASSASSSAAASTSASASASAKTSSSGDVFDQAIAKMTEYYMGVTEAGETVYYAGNDTEAILCFLDPASAKSASFVGSVTSAGTDSAGAPMLTVTDSTTGNTLTFSVAQGTDGTVVLDMGSSLGKATIAACTADEIATAFKQINAGATEVNK